MLCSVGEATPKSGVYSISDKYVWRLLQGNVYGQYACRITGHILFHSVPYVSKDKATLEWWEYDKLGTSASLGCVRLKVDDVKWIYDNCISGTKVEFYSDSNPGPLGKPTVRKISSDEEVRNWDPSDPDKDNPWNEYLKKKEQEKKQQQSQAVNAKPVESNTTNKQETTSSNTITEEKTIQDKETTKNTNEINNNSSNVNINKNSNNVNSEVKENNVVDTKSSKQANTNNIAIN